MFNATHLGRLGPIFSNPPAPCQEAAELRKRTACKAGGQVRGKRPVDVSFPPLLRHVSVTYEPSACFTKLAYNEICSALLSHFRAYLLGSSFINLFDVITRKTQSPNSKSNTFRDEERNGFKVPSIGRVPCIFLI